MTPTMAMRFLVALVAGGCFLEFPRPAQAFCRTWNCDPTVKSCPHPAGEQRDDPKCPGGTAPVFWAASCVGFTIQQNASSRVSFDTFAPIAQQAFAAWQDVRCGGQPPSIELTYMGPVACSQQEFNVDRSNANLLVFRDGTWPYVGDINTLALTTLTFNPNSGEIYDADMEINSTEKNKLYVGDGPIKPNEADLLSVITHEVGHFLGVGHSTMERDATGALVTMWAKYSRGTTSIRKLSLDDQAAMCAIYPPNRPGLPACDPTPRNGFSTTCGSDSPLASSSATTPATSCGYAAGSRSSSFVPGLVVLMIGVASARRQRQRQKR